MTCETHIDCDNQSLSVEDLIRKLIRTDSNGCPALNTTGGTFSPPPLDGMSFKNDAAGYFVSDAETITSMNSVISGASKKFSIALWVKIVNLEVGTILTDGVNYFPLQLHFKDIGGGILFIGFASGSGVDSTTWKSTTGAISQGAWTHIVVEWDFSQIQALRASMYINGIINAITVSTTAGSGVGTSLSTGTEYWLMAENGPTPADMILADFAIYNGNLTALEVLELYNSGTPINPTTVAIEANWTHWYFPSNAVFGANWTMTNEITAGEDFVSTGLAADDRILDYP